MKRPAALVGLALLVMTGPARSQTRDPAAARALFEEATRLLDKSDWDQACPKFAASFRFKPTVSALFNVARCHEHAGKLTLAADDYHLALTLNEETADPTRRKELGDFTDGALRALEARIPRLRIAVKDPPAGLLVTRDGQDLSATALGVPLPADPGEHVVVASAPGRKTETVRVSLVEGKEARVEIYLVRDAAEPAVVPAPGPAPAHVAAPLPPPPVAPAVAPVPPVAAAAQPSGGTPAWAWITGAAGLVLGGAALGFAVDGAGANCGGRCTADKFTQGQVDGLNARRHRDLGLGLGLGGLGAVGVTVGAVGIAGGTRARPAAGLLVRPWMEGGARGLSLQGAL